MKKIRDIYKEYKLTPALQLHQLRVAAVASLICDNSQGVDKSTVLKTCLFHDMGNIIKFDLAYFPEFLEPEGLDYWQAVKDEYIRKYGPDEHVATRAIAEELGLSQPVIECMEYIGFTRADRAVLSVSMEQKICCYADQRVGPHGVMSLEERRNEGMKRYSSREDKKIAAEIFQNLRSSLAKLEDQIFINTKLKPEDINDITVAPIIEQLKEKEM